MRQFGADARGGGRLCVGMKRRGCNAFLLQFQRLVAHQGDQRRHDQGEAGAGKGRKLINQRFSAASRQNGEYVLALQQRADRLGLAGQEVRMAESAQMSPDGLQVGHKRIQ